MPESTFATCAASPAADAVRFETLAGETHLVAPVVLVTEGVLNGGFLSAEEIQRSVPGWNSVPVTAPPSADLSSHPVDENGEFTTANTVEHWEQYVIGQTFAVEYDDEIRGLRGELWLNIERAKRVGEQAIAVLRRLNDGESLEVSTGYWHAWESESGTFEGQSYDQIQFDLIPDHLATLPNETGACSWADGCGAPRVNALLADGGETEGMVEADTGNGNRITRAVNVLLGNETCACGGHADPDPSANRNASPRTPEYSETETSPAWGEVSLSFEAFRDAYADSDASEWADLSEADRSAIAARSLNGDAGSETFEDGVVLPVVNPASDNLNETGLEAALSRAPQTDGIDADATQSRIRSLLEGEFDRDVSENTNMSNEDDDPEVDIEALAEVSAFDADYLSEHPDVAQGVHESMESAREAATTDPEGEAPEGEADPTGTGNTEADPEGGSGDDDPPAYITHEEAQEMAAQAAQEAVEQAQATDRRVELIETITTHTDREADSLSGLELDSLEIMADMAEERAPDSGPKTGVNYLGRGQPASNTDDEPDPADYASVGALAALTQREAENGTGGDD